MICLQAILRCDAPGCQASTPIEVPITALLGFYADGTYANDIPEFGIIKLPEGWEQAPRMYGRQHIMCKDHK